MQTRALADTNAIRFRLYCWFIPHGSGILESVCRAVRSQPFWNCVRREGTPSTSVSLRARRLVSVGKMAFLTLPSSRASTASACRVGLAVVLERFQPIFMLDRWKPPTWARTAIRRTELGPSKWAYGTDQAACLPRRVAAASHLGLSRASNSLPSTRRLRPRTPRPT